VNKKDFLSYNHSDSYPACLGVEMAKFVLRIMGPFLAKYKKLAEKLVLVDDSKAPTPEQIKKLSKYADTGVATGKLTDWYCLLRNCQGDPMATLESGYMRDAAENVADSMDCEWAYIVNFDTGKLEVYKGWQTKPHKKGRYAKLPVTPNNCGDTFYPIALIVSIPFADVTQDGVEALDKEEEACMQEGIVIKEPEKGVVVKYKPAII
jgi:hypothetical protein